MAKAKEGAPEKREVVAQMAERQLINLEDEPIQAAPLQSVPAVQQIIPKQKRQPYFAASTNPNRIKVKDLTLATMTTEAGVQRELLEEVNAILVHKMN